MAFAHVGITFSIDSAAVGPARGIGIPAQQAVQSLLGRRAPVIEACEPAEGRLIPCGFHGFAGTVHFACSFHAPLTIAPDHVWLVIAQGLAAHVQLDPRRCGSQAVHRRGRRTLDIRNGLLAGHAPADDWSSVWDTLARQLRDECPDLFELLVPQFSTTSRSDRLACVAATMDVFEPSFEYRVRTARGIPAVTLEGTYDDWMALRQRAGRLRAFGLQWWLDALLPVLDQFVAASAGDVDLDWWQGFFTEGGAAGGCCISGHIRALFPYLCFKERTIPRRIVRQSFFPSGPDPASALTSDVLPCGLSKMAFTGRHRGKVLPLEVVAGFVGIRQFADAATLRPEVGWAVRVADAPRPAEAVHLSA